MLRVERKRTERSKIPFILMLADLSSLAGNDHTDLVNKFIFTLASCLRETDILGWYKQKESLGVIFTGLVNHKSTHTEKILQKMHKAFHHNGCDPILEAIKISFYHYPEDHNDGDGSVFNGKFYPDISSKMASKKGPIFLKRTMDILLSLLLLILTAPLFLAIAIVIKLTSPGPVLFKQKRLGLNGREFIFLKFRTMAYGNDDQCHQQYVQSLICNGGERTAEPGVYKMQEDSRVTPFGSLLRRSSLDEIPQIINVLKGEMSLIGPRPPIPYEFQMYDIWHRERLLSCKPGITGLWQVNGRSAVSFDEMVRLDLEYIENWSLWKDICILFKTPFAVLSGKGAY
jgi:lipopolysaccharide/colanic/teichoic acid biosynthesis glycosyltransferase